MERIAILTSTAPLRKTSSRMGVTKQRINLQAAVEHLERAVELRPDDPVINDHLGDIYWQIGRKLEAKYQWQQSLTLKPDKDLVVAVERKLKDGLVAGNETKAAGAMVQPAQKVAE